MSAAAGPQLPCGDAPPVPAFASPGPVPAVRVWFADNLDGPWRPPACLDWQPLPDALLVATAGRFHEPGGMAAIAGRFAAISRLAEVRYWSVTRQRWRQLITAAHALTAPVRGRQRPDFTADEFRAGAELYFWQDEATPAGSVIYRLDVRDRTPGRLAVSMTNASPVRFLLLPLFDPGDYRFVYVIEHEGGDLWRYYSLMRTPTPAVPDVRGHRASYINRAVAIFRHIAGLPTDAEPPLAPGP